MKLDGRRRAIDADGRRPHRPRRPRPGRAASGPPWYRPSGGPDAAGTRNRPPRAPPDPRREPRRSRRVPRRSRSGRRSSTDRGSSIVRDNTRHRNEPARGWPTHGASPIMVGLDRPATRRSGEAGTRMCRKGGPLVFQGGFGRLLFTMSAIGSMMIVAPTPAIGDIGPPKRPNVVLIITDDQGYGDLGFHGNPRIKTPNLDRFARESVRLKTFCVSPVCSPTRASLLTGRYNYRTGVVDTYLGPVPDAPRRDDARGGARRGRLSNRHLRQVAPRRQRPDAGDRPGIPEGPGDQGRRHRPGVRPAGRQQLFSTRSSRTTAGRGRCRAIAATSTPAPPSTSSTPTTSAHSSPTWPSTARTSRSRCPRPSWPPIEALTSRPSAFPQLGHPVPPDRMTPTEDIARVYAMVTNIDTNVGRLLDALDIPRPRR